MDPRTGELFTKVQLENMPKEKLDELVMMEGREVDIRRIAKLVENEASKNESI